MDVEYGHAEYVLYKYYGQYVINMHANKQLVNSENSSEVLPILLMFCLFQFSGRT